ncbi:exodeoxyribonuclease VII small subunit [Tissierella sp.]|uniref:exodeoxyribonuclease VII small subunit n=1 Tax=Tissierella sp. TaxID=41274 RepID=UPI002866E799|nr:exodeoxyribonuclease VII small subunit [Tissierella sp.]MDR7856150.1 exodeoxyribonuclease VII small subunit [Tissierella sp.]
METNSLTYEEAVSKLESILKELESGNCSINDTIEKFKNGVELYNYSNDLLLKAEGEIKILLKDDGRSMKEVLFPTEG